MSSMKCISQVVNTQSPLPPFDVHASLMSLPHILQGTLKTIPAMPYLEASSGDDAGLAGETCDGEFMPEGRPGLGRRRNHKRESFSLASSSRI